MRNDDTLKDDTVIGSISGDEARQATEHEHDLSFFEALKLYPTAVGWSVFFSLGIIMTAFDPQLLGELVPFLSDPSGIGEMRESRTVRNVHLSHLAGQLC